MTAERVAQMQKSREESAKSRIGRALKAGVRIAFGSEMYDHNDTWTRGSAALTGLESYGRSGMAPLEVIRTATTNAADLLGLANRIGSLEPGKFADIIAFDGDPLADLSHLRKVKFVMKAGEAIRR